LVQMFERSGDAALVNEAIALAQAAVALTPQGHDRRPGFLTTLGTALSRLGEGESGTARLQEAVQAYRDALKEYTREKVPLQWATTQNNLGNALQTLGERESGTARLDHLNEAKMAWSGAVALLEVEIATEARPSLLASTAARYNRRLAALLLGMEDHIGVIETLERGRGVQARAELARDAAVPIRLSSVDQARYRELVVTERAARGRCREMQTAVQQTKGMLVSLEAKIKETDADAPTALRQMKQAVAAAESEALAALQELGRLRAEREALERKDPDFVSKAPAYADIRRLAVDYGEAIVYLQPLDEKIGTRVVIVHVGAPEAAPGEREVVAIPEVTPDSIWQLLVGKDNKVREAHWNKLRAGKVTDVPAADVGWLMAYRFWLLTLSEKALHPLIGQATELWYAAMAATLARLGRALMAPVGERLRRLGVRRVVLIPGDRLGLLPLHAAEITAGVPFADRFETRYAPSAAVLARCHARLGAGPPVEPHLTAIANPARDLDFADAQVERIARLFPAHRRHVAHGTRARRAWLLEHAPKADILELSTHASFDHEDPSLSAFLLAHPEGRYGETAFQHRAGTVPGDFERLTLNDIQSGRLSLKEGSLVVANACETGLIDFSSQAMDESLGFPSAFLSRGASTVLASFWAVADFSTALLMEAVYALMIGKGYNPAAAARRAARWLRSRTKVQVVAWLERERQTVKERLASMRAIAGSAWTAWHDEEYRSLANRQAKINLAIGTHRKKDAPARPFEKAYYWAPFAAHGAVRRTHQAPRPS
ncbi:MAG: CHAT domain-containing protein, partial [Hyphomicrobiaceae bacterium]